MKSKVDEVFVGKVRLLSIEGERSGIVKSPAAGPVMLTPTGLEGDEQADLRHHGGLEKALHHYPVEHYAVLAAEWPQCAAALGAGFLGENISTHGLDEHVLCIGDVLRIGAARVQVSQTRSPCWKIDLRLQVEGASRFVEAAGITGWYYRVLQPGRIAAGDTIELLERPNPWLTLADYWDTVSAHRPDAGLLARIAGAPGLAGDKATRWRERAAWLRAQGVRKWPARRARAWAVAGAPGTRDTTGVCAQTEARRRARGACRDSQPLPAGRLRMAFKLAVFTAIVGCDRRARRPWLCGVGARLRGCAGVAREDRSADPDAD